MVLLKCQGKFNNKFKYKFKYIFILRYSHFFESPSRDIQPSYWLNQFDGFGNFGYSPDVFKNRFNDKDVTPLKNVFYPSDVNSAMKSANKSEYNEMNDINESNTRNMYKRNLFDNKDKNDFVLSHQMNRYFFIYLFK